MASVQDLEKQKQQNSTAWHSATTQEEKDRLHQANIDLQKQIDTAQGSTSSFNSGTGTWTTTPAAKSTNNQNLNQLPTGGVGGSAIGSGGGAPTGRTPAYNPSQQTSAQAPNTSTTQSQASSGVPSGYQGSATGVQGYTSDQQADIDKMNRNSIAYYETSDPAERQRLHKENQDIADRLGGSVVFDTTTGTWKGTADAQKQTVSYADNTGYIEDMYKAKQAAALAALRAAYEKNVAGLNRAQSAIAPQYQSARDEAAAQSELQKRNFAEYAAANGLNSGAGGQAQLAFTNALQGNLSSLAAKEASTLADLELQRSQMEADYENAIAQAEAQGNYELAQQLYQEKVRQDEAMRQQMQWQAQMDLQTQQFQFNKDQTAIGNEQWNRQQATSDQQYNQQFALKMAQELAQYGNFEGYRALGYTDEQIQSMRDYWNYIQQQDTSKSATSGGGWAAGLNAPSSTGMSDVNFNGLKQTVQAHIRNGDINKALEVANSTWNALTQDQRNQLITYFSHLGYTLGEG